MNKQVSYQKVLRIMKMKDSIVNITPRVYQSLESNCVTARVYLDITVVLGGFIYKTETNVNSERFFVRGLVKDNIHISRSGLRSSTLEELLMYKGGCIAEDSVELSVSRNFGKLFD